MHSYADMRPYHTIKDTVEFDEHYLYQTAIYNVSQIQLMLIQVWLMLTLMETR